MTPDRLGIGLDAKRQAGGARRDVGETGAGQCLGELVGVPGPDVGPRGGEQVGLGAGRDNPPVPDHDQVVGDDLDLVQEVRREQDGGATVGVAAEQVTHPADAGGVEPVGGFVEDEDLGITEEGMCDAEALAHAEGVVAHAASGLFVGEADQVEHLVDPSRGQTHQLLREGEDLATCPAGMLRGRVEEHPHLGTRVGQVGEPAPEDVGAARARWSEADDDPQGGGLPGPVGAEEPGDPAGLRGERDMVDRGEVAVLLGDRLDGDHRASPISAVTGDGLKPLTMR